MKMYIKLVSLQLLVFCLSIDCRISKKVKLSVYFESLCPDSRRFITDQLTPTYQTLSSILDIEFVPFGNSNWTYNTTTRDVVFECQHGLEECFGNRLQSCLISKAGNNTELKLKFIDCMFRSHKWRKHEITARNCSHQLGIDWTPLYDCAIGPYSTVLQLEMSNKTLSLKPPQNWIPWITIDGKHSDDIQILAETDLQKLVCDSYALEKPIECKRKAIRDAKYESFPISRYISKEGIIEP